MRQGKRGKGLGKGEGPTSKGRRGDVKGGDRGKGREKEGETKGGKGEGAGCAVVKILKICPESHGV